jgi:signal transduction histidine kinase
VFWNFCENAVRAMRNGGTLRVSLQAENSDWHLGFADTGAGMRPELVEKMFEPFQSEFEHGTGLGLAIVYQIVQAHEGKVWARSKVGQGSEFILRLRQLAAAEDVPVADAVADAGHESDVGAVAASAATASQGGRAHG